MTATKPGCLGTRAPSGWSSRASARPTGVAGPSAIHRRTDVTIKKLSETPIVDTGHKVDARNL